MKSRFALLVALALGALFALKGNDSLAIAQENSCEKLGWFPEEFGLKDHSVFWYDGYYYLISIHAPTEKQFAYARSKNFCDWEQLPFVLPKRPSEGVDERSIWAPYVEKFGDTYYMYYTGVNDTFTQRIMLATTKNPADASSWREQGVVFQPDHDGMIWQEGIWSSCRDPMVIELDGQYFLYYTGKDTEGGIVGVATSLSPDSPWLDWGAIIPPLRIGMAESPTVSRYSQAFYLFYNNTSSGEVYRVGPSPTGPWSDQRGFKPGWAHEIWQTISGEWYTSFLTDYSVTISPLTWDTYFTPARPFIGENVSHSFVPLIWQEQR